MSKVQTPNHPAIKVITFWLYPSPPLSPGRLQIILCYHSLSHMTCFWLYKDFVPLSDIFYPFFPSGPSGTTSDHTVISRHSPCVSLCLKLFIGTCKLPMLMPAISTVSSILFISFLFSNREETWIRMFPIGMRDRCSQAAPLIGALASS